MNDCIFCKIAKGDIPVHKVFEDDEFIAFLDNKPTSPGHTLLIPKEHYETMLETPADIMGRMAATIPTLAQAVMKGSKAQGFNVGCNNGEVAGQSVAHVHIHIIPRYTNDGLVSWHGQELLEEEEAQKTAKAIRAAL